MSRFSSVGRALDCNSKKSSNPQVAGSIPASEMIEYNYKVMCIIIYIIYLRIVFLR